MAQMLLTPFPAPRRQFWLGVALVAAALLLAVLARGVLLAQVEGERGIAAVASSGDIQIGGIRVDVSGKNADEARESGWKLAQRLGWEKLKGPKVSDSQLESMVSAIVIEHEQIGRRRYVATLGVIFDRSRAGGLLGAGGPVEHSAPMLLVPVLYSGGTQTVFEVRNPWQRAWAEYQAGASAIDYVRPSGAGGDSLLLTFGQTERRSRAWWRNILDEFGAADVLMAIARVERQWPGGPVKGTFTARYGPDNRFLESFTLRADSENDVPAMYQKALARFDSIYTGALNRGLLKPDPTLVAQNAQIDPVLAALLAAGRNADAADALLDPAASLPGAATPPPVSVAASTYTVQFASPDASAVDSALAIVRSTAGVQGAATSSIAIGGTSVMKVTFAGGIEELAAALRARGWQVVVGNNALSIRR